MAESDWVDITSSGSSDGDWVDVGSSAPQGHPLDSEANLFQKGASGYLKGVSGLGDLGDLFMKYFPFSPTFGQSKQQTGESLGDSARSGFDYLTGVKDSTRIGEDTFAHKIGEYLPATLMGGESLVENGVGGAIKSLAKTAVQDTLAGTGGYVGNKVAGTPGEIIGSIAGGSLPDAINWSVAGKGQGLLDSLIGYDPAAKQKVAGYLDSEGNLVPQAVPGGTQVGKKDLAAMNLRDTGFFDNVKVTDSPSSLSNKLSIFKQNAGEDLSKIVDDAANAEKNLFSKASVQQNAAYATQTNPEFSGAQDFIDSTTDSRLKATLQRKLDDVTTRWNSSAQTLGDLKQLQQDFGLTNKSSFASSAEKAINTLNNRIYGALAESVQGKIDLIGQAIGRDTLGSEFTAANKAFSAASTFEDSALKASRNFGIGQGAKDVASLKTAGSFAAAHLIPGLGPLLFAKRLGTIGADIAPVQAAKILGRVESMSGALGQNLPAKLAGLNEALPLLSQGSLSQEQIQGERSAPSDKVDAPSLDRKIADAVIQSKSPKTEPSNSSNFIDKAMDRAENKTNNVAPEAPTIISAKRVDHTNPTELATVMQEVFKQESGGRADAVSKVGAKGVGQLMDATGKELFAKYKDILPEGSNKKYDPFDATQNKILSTMYMKELLQQFDGDLPLALTAYNQGPGRVKNLLKIHDATSLDEIRPFLGKDGKAYAISIITKLKKQGVISV